MKIKGLVHDIVLSLLLGYALKLMLLVAGASFINVFIWKTVSDVLVSSPTLPKPGERTAIALLISEHYFLDVFGERAPLDRGELSKLISAVAKSLTKTSHVVVIDFDLSPVGNGHIQTKAQDELDEQLQVLAKKARVILACPLSKERNLQRAQFTWSESLVEKTKADREDGRGIEFASTFLKERMGAVLDYTPDGYILGARAGKQHLALSVGVPVSQDRKCRDIADTEKSKKILIQDKVIEHNAYTRVFTYSVDSANDAEEKLTKHLRETVSPQLIVIGGGYSNSNDEFNVVTIERLPGAVVHAAIAVSEKAYASFVEVAAQWMTTLIAYSIMIGVVLFFGGWLSPKVIYLSKPSTVIPRNGLPPKWCLQFLWGPHGRHAGWVYAETWLRWLTVSAILVSLLICLVLIFASVIFLMGVWYDFVPFAIAAWLKVIAGTTQEAMGLLGDSARYDTRDIYRSPSIGNPKVWIWTSVLIRVVIIFVGLVYLILSVSRGLTMYIVVLFAIVLGYSQPVIAQDIVQFDKRTGLASIKCDDLKAQLASAPSESRNVCVAGRGRLPRCELVTSKNVTQFCLEASTLPATFGAKLSEIGKDIREGVTRIGGRRAADDQCPGWLPEGDLLLPSGELRLAVVGNPIADVALVAVGPNSRIALNGVDFGAGKVGISANTLRGRGWILHGLLGGKPFVCKFSVVGNDEAEKLTATFRQLGQFGVVGL
jgi:hypothetical protein